MVRRERPVESYACRTPCTGRMHPRLDIRRVERHRFAVRRRDVLGWAAAATAGGLISRDAWAGRRPGLMSVMSGDPTPGTISVWSATDRAARMWIEWSTDPTFTQPKRIEGPTALQENGFTARLVLEDLPPGHVFYRVGFASDRTHSRVQSGRLWTPAPDKRSLRIGWGGDVAGQGFGIDVQRGGMRMFETLRQRDFDVFIHSGDHVYADGPLQPELRLDDSTTWTNLVTKAKSEVAQSLDGFRGQYAYNLLDPNYRAFFAQTPVIAQWDDHELRNNWYPTQVLEDGRYREKSVRKLAGWAKRAFFDFMPIRGSSVFRHLPHGPLADVFVVDARSFRAANSANRQPNADPSTVMFGEQQLAQLCRAIKASAGTWKVIACDVPIGLVVPDGEAHQEGIANGDGPPLGREHEIARLLRFLRRQAIRNVVFVTADVHYAAAHLYRPDRAKFTEFDPFWEFVAGPLHAGTFGPNRLDPTFGPEVMFTSVPEGMKPNRPPSEGKQFFGEMQIDGKTEVMQVSLRDITGRALFTQKLEPFV